VIGLTAAGNQSCFIVVSYAPAKIVAFAIPAQCIRPVRHAPLGQ
jgi:hypothetical protein